MMISDKEGNNQTWCRRKPRGSLLVLFFIVLTATEAAALADFDFDCQFWLTTKLDAKLSKRWSAWAKNEIRIGHTMAKAEHFHGEVGIKIRAHQLLTAGVFYRQAFSGNTLLDDIDETPRKVWSTEFQPGAFLKLSLTPGEAVFSDAIRFEVPTHENNKGTAFRIKHTTFLGIKVFRRPFVSVIPYLKNVQLFNCYPNYAYAFNRTALGVILPAAKFLDLDFYYMWQRKIRGDDHVDYFILGLVVLVKI